MSRVDPPLTVARIKRAVASHYGIHLSDLEGRDLEAWASHPRQVAMFLARKLVTRPPEYRTRERTAIPFTDIARLFDRDHSTVIFAVRAVEHRIATDPGTARDVRHLTAALEAGRWAA